MSLELDAQEPHPLFPPKDNDDECSVVETIQVIRVENGKRIFSPRTFRQEDLQSLEQLNTEYGGGDYELVARAKGRITDRAKYSIPGKSKPLFDSGVDETEVVKPVNHSVTVPVSNDPMQAMMSGQGGVMGLIMMMMQQMMQQQAAQQQSSTQLMVAMMQAGGDRSSESTKLMIENQRIQAEAASREKDTQMAFMRELMQLRNVPEAAGSEAAFLKGMEFAQGQFKNQIETIKSATAKNGEIDWESLLETGMQVLGGIQQFKGVFDMGNPAAAAAEAVVGAAT